MVRRRVVRWEETEKDDSGERMILYCPRNEKQYQVDVCSPDEPRVAEIQQQLGKLLYADAK
jgi:hypothetical protein